MNIIEKWMQKKKEENDPYGLVKSWWSYSSVFKRKN
jgi:hypothetical protein